ncbi:hypothetical protein [Coleofasciculus sp.]|uniref:hypothetical protein n=1 Tax=Coleofasciculus sp. TaxID=3100458 RepID=UPI0039FA1F60
MNDQELATLLNDLESDRVERKALISDRSIIRQAICAFANDLPNHQQPGVLLARKELQKNGNPPLEFVVEDAHLLVTLKKKP